MQDMDDIEKSDIRNFRDKIEQLLYDGPGICVLKNAPVENEQEAQEFLESLGSLIGEQVSQTTAGETVVRVEDAGANASDPTQRGHKTGAKLPYHVDRTDVIALMCIRPAEQGGRSTVASSKYVYDILAEENSDLLEELKAPLPHDRRGEQGEGEKPWNQIPIFSEDDGRIVCRYVRRFFDSSQRHPDAPRLTPNQVAAMDALDEVLERETTHYVMDLAPGDIQLIENHGILHSRTAFSNLGGQGRLLLRLWLATSRSPRLPDEYKELYGSVEPGVLRGGVWREATEMGHRIKRPTWTN